MVNNLLNGPYRIGGLVDYDDSDPNSRGPFVIIVSDYVDGNVADVYGETIVKAEKMAKSIVGLLNTIENVKRGGKSNV